jgi:orotidine-5'-phosphate decarboxylase
VTPPVPAPDVSLVSTKKIPRRERLIFPLDVDTDDEALALVRELGDAVWFYKIGFQLLLGGHYLELLERLADAGKRVFVDLKLFDVPETVASAVRQLSRRRVDFVTVHANEGMLAAACEARSGELRVLAVTVLTSLDQGDVRDLGFQVDVEELVLSRARRALALGCDGVVSSGLEARALREGLGDKFLVVSPGIRPVENRTQDDQKRVVSVEQAFLGGADYIVVGRPIRNAPDRRAAAAAIQQSIAQLFPG